MKEYYTRIYLATETEHKHPCGCELVCEDGNVTLYHCKLHDNALNLRNVVEHVLIASEDGGEMNDIDWKWLRSAWLNAGGKIEKENKNEQ